MTQWRASLESVWPLLKNEDHLTMVMNCSLRWVYNLEVVEDFTTSHYLYNRVKAIDRIKRYLKAIDTKKAPILAIQAHVEFMVAPQAIGQDTARL